MICGSVVLAVFAIAFPIYIYCTHGLAVLPVYGSGGSLSGHANYFHVSLLFSAFALALSAVSYKAARWALSKRRGE